MPSMRTNAAVAGVLLPVVMLDPGLPSASMAAGKPSRPAGEDTPVITVAADGSAEHRSIQEAVDVAPGRATVRVAPGVYRERVVITKPVTLEGAGWARTTLAPMHVWSGELRELFLEVQRRREAARSEAEREAIESEYEAKYGGPLLTVRDTRDVVIRGLKITGGGESGRGALVIQTLVLLENTEVVVERCAVLGAFESCVLVAGPYRGNVEIRESLVAASWRSGIKVGRQTRSKARAHLRDSEVRNCHYANVFLSTQDATSVVERCRVSGAGGPGIRYDNSSPRISGNLVFANEGAGIQAAGGTGGTVEGNVIHGNGASGFLGLGSNRDTVERNTFVRNRQDGLWLRGPGAPVVRRNVFHGHPRAVVVALPGGDATLAEVTAKFSGNLFWQNEARLVQSSTGDYGAEAASREVELSAGTASLSYDPRFRDPRRRDFSLDDDSPARRDGVGAVGHLSFRSPWPLQPEEARILPDGDTREQRKWRGGLTGNPARP